MKTMSKILITGAAGFIGYHLAKQLDSLGYDVIGLDNYNDYYDVDLKRARAKNLPIQIHDVDLRDAYQTSYLLNKEKPNLVIHLAASAGVRHSMEDPMLYVTNNIVASQNLIDACEKAGIYKVIHASTSCVSAGNPLPWKEDQNLGHQLNPYGYTKACNESQFMASSIPATIGLRFFTVYGPWGRPDMALFKFTDHIINDKPIDVFNYGNMIRDFTYIDDIVQGIVILTSKIFNESEIKEIYNIGRGEMVNLMDFINEIEKNLDKQAIKNYLPKHPADTQATWSDTTKLQELGYKPIVSIPEGVENFIRWYKHYYNKN